MISLLEFLVKQHVTYDDELYVILPVAWAVTACIKELKKLYKSNLIEFNPQKYWLYGTKSEVYNIIDCMKKYNKTITIGVDFKDSLEIYKVSNNIIQKMINYDSDSELADMKNIRNQCKQHKTKKELLDNIKDIIEYNENN